MRQLVIFMLALSFLFNIAGCQEGIKNKSTADQELVLLNTDIFPKELAGRWIEKEGAFGWEIVLTEEGKVSELVHTMGQVKVIPGKVNRYPLIEQGVGLIQPGKIVVQFNKENRELAVEIGIERFKWVKGTDIIEGALTDVFIGFVSDDYRMWDTDWLNKEYYVATTSEVKDKVLAQDEDLKEREYILFVKKESKE